MPAFSKKRCMERCQSLPSAPERVRCCADCRALEAARIRQQRELALREATRGRPPGAPPRRSSQRWEVLFSSGPRAKTRATRRREAARVRPLAGLGNAADDRRAATLTAQTAHGIAMAGCNIGYPNESQRRDREACVAAANAALAAALAIVNAATEGGDEVDVTAAIEEALEEQQRETNELLAAAEVDRQRAELEAERRRREEEERRSKSTQTTLVVGGLIVAVAAIGGYVLLRDDDKSTAAPAAKGST